MAMHCAVAHRRRGELTPGEQGREMVEAADRRLAAQGVKNPARMVEMYAPSVPVKPSPPAHPRR